ncbi:hypothetical protein J18TS1_12290 [Oceanobacillus oncorhynchi subsp. incaldanensis]|nr:hypothetical protein [Oceanobacillus oncorhynchi]GIO18129.1 hypothetical protein J18TS1_12290 [Oceanobacillus oncorhynchi subsp. incaldanensis]
MDKLCPACGEAEMKHWNMDIYECPNCRNMIDGEDLEEIYEGW